MRIFQISRKKMCLIVSNVAEQSSKTKTKLPLGFTRNYLNAQISIHKSRFILTFKIAKRSQIQACIRNKDLEFNAQHQVFCSSWAT